MRTFVGLHFFGVAVGAAGLWWVIYPDAPGAALSDAITAGATAGYVELAAARMGWWS